MKKVLFIFAALLLLTQCKSKKNLKENVQTQTKDAVEQATMKPDKDYIPFDPDVRMGKLDNGLTYYIRKNKKPEKRAFMLLPMKVGSILEDDDQLGLAHFMEHMNFNGLKDFPKNKLVDYLQSIGVEFGADLNAFTSFDKTVYILPLPVEDPEKLDKGLLVLQNWAYYANLTPEEIDKERGVVLEELRLGLGPDKRMMDKWLPVAFHNSRYAERLPIGKKEILENFPHEVLKRFHKDWYRPDLQAVIVVGDINPDEIEQKIKKLFSEIPKAENPRERKYYPVPNHQETLVAVADDPEAGFNRVMIMYKDHEDYQPMVTADDYKNYLKDKLFSEMMKSRLEDIKEGENPPFSFAFASHGLSWARTKETFNLTALTNPKDRLKALETLLKEAKKVKEYGFTQAELERAKKKVLADMEQAYQNRNTTESRKFAWEYAAHFLEDQPAPGIRWEYDMHKWFIPQIKLGEVNALAKKFIHDDNRVVIVTGKDVPKVTEDQVWDVIKRVDTIKVENNSSSELATSLMKEKPIPGKIVKEEKDEKLGTVTWTLQNGAKVTWKKTDFKEDEVKTGLYKFGGKSRLSDEELKKTAFAFQAVPMAGVNGMKNREVKKILSGKKAVYKPGMDEVDSYATGETRPKDLEDYFQLQYLYFTKLNKDPKAFESWKKRQAFMINLTNQPQFKFFLALSDFMNQNNPRYIPPFPTKEWIENQDYDLAYAKFKEAFDGATGYHFYIVGNFDENQLKSLVETYIGGLPESKTPDAFVKHPDYSLKGEHNFEFKAGKEPKSMVIIVMEGDAKYAPEDKLKLEMLGKILTNKLIEKLREEKSGVYGVGARGGMKKYPHEKWEFTIAFPCGPENAKELTQFALDELNKLIQNGPSEEDLNKVKESLKVHFKENLKKNEFWVEYLSDTDYYGLNPHRLFDFEKQVEAITSKDIQKTGKKYISNPQTKVIATWYPEEEKN